MDSHNKLLPVLFGTFTMTFIYIFPVLNLINIFCCAGIIAGGFAGVFIYNKETLKSGLKLTAKDGGMIGILSGFLSAIIVTGFGLLMSLYSSTNPMLDFLKSIDDAGISIPEEMTVYLEKISNEFSEKGFSPTITLVSFISNIILFPLFGSFGALLGVSYFNKKNKLQS